MIASTLLLLSGVSKVSWSYLKAHIPVAGKDLEAEICAKCAITGTNPGT